MPNGWLKTWDAAFCYYYYVQLMESDCVCVTINKIDSYAINFICVYLTEFQLQYSIYKCSECC